MYKLLMEGDDDRPEGDLEQDRQKQIGRPTPTAGD